jgi:preprotein translocase subunit SecD
MLAKENVKFDLEEMDLQMFADGDDDDGGDDGGDDEGGSDEELSPEEIEEKYQSQINSIEQKHQSELDKYRNEAGHLRKEMEKIKQKGMSEEDKLEQQQKKLEEREKELQVKELETTRAAKVAEVGLDERLVTYLDVDHEMSESEVEKAVDELDTTVKAVIKDEIQKLKESGSIVSTQSGGSESTPSYVQAALDEVSNEQEVDGYNPWE